MLCYYNKFKNPIPKRSENTKTNTKTQKQIQKVKQYPLEHIKHYIKGLITCITIFFLKT